jgi:hypothetical protein
VGVAEDFGDGGGIVDACVLVAVGDGGATVEVWVLVAVGLSSAWIKSHPAVPATKTMAPVAFRKSRRVILKSPSLAGSLSLDRTLAEAVFFFFLLFIEPPNGQKASELSI